MAKRNYENMTPLEVYALVVRGTIKKFPNGYLDKDKVKILVRHVILTVYNYTKEDVLEKINHKFFQDNFLGGVRKLFDFGDNEVLIYSFPEWELKQWNFRKVPPNFWKNKTNQKDFVLWICNIEGLNPNKKEDMRKITAEVVEKYGGSKPMVGAGGLYELISTVTGSRYKKWELMRPAVWSKQEAIVATRWLIEEKLKLTPKEVCKLSVSDFAKYNLDGMLQKLCDHSILKALEMAYPGTYYRSNVRGILYKLSTG